MPVKVIEDIPILYDDAAQECFHCEGEKKIIRAQSTATKKTYQVVCEGCGQAGPECSDEHAAIHKWDVTQEALDYYDYRGEENARQNSETA